MTKLTQNIRTASYIIFAASVILLVGLLTVWSWQTDARIICSFTKDPQKIQACETLEIPTFREYKIW